jgi:tetratricopeptide (TPR) repeat protein
MTGRLLRFPKALLSSEEWRLAGRRILEKLPADRVGNSSDLGLEEPETLLAISEYLRDLSSDSPAKTRDEADFFYRFLEKPRRPLGLFDERDYFLGEFGLIAGTACRQLSRRDEARLWFDRAEAAFRHTVNSEADLARLAYQRLALRLEERQIDAVMELVPPLIESFQKLGMHEDAVKCRFLHGLALMTSGSEEAVAVFSEICLETERLGNRKLLAAGLVNLTHAFALFGEFGRAAEASEKAIPLLRAVNDKIGLAKVEWGLGTLLREQGQIPSAIEMYRASQKDLNELGVRADVAALSLVVADLLLETGHDKDAMQEILRALPVIDELKMVPEGMAALSLLRESVRHQSVNRQALRDLHGYFEDLKS